MAGGVDIVFPSGTLLPFGSFSTTTALVFMLNSTAFWILFSVLLRLLPQNLANSPGCVSTVESFVLENLQVQHIQCISVNTRGTGHFVTKPFSLSTWGSVDNPGPITTAFMAFDLSRRKSVSLSDIIPFSSFSGNTIASGTVVPYIAQGIRELQDTQARFPF